MKRILALALFAAATVAAFSGSIPRAAKTPIADELVSAITHVLSR